MYRDRTNLFVSYRRTVPRNISSYSDSSTENITSAFSDEEQGLIVGRRSSRNPRKPRQSIEMKVLPPSFFDIGLQIDEFLKNIAGKVAQLNSLYKKNLLPGFNDRTSDEEEIEQLNYEITKTFQECYVLVKKFEFLQKNAKRLNYLLNEVQMIENLKKNSALRIQTLSSNFRKLQSNYIKFLKEDDFEQAPLMKKSGAMGALDATGAGIEQDSSIEDYSRQALQQSQISAHLTNEQMVLQREQEISKLAMGVLEVSSIFREMETLIIDQGTILDRIDYNLANTVQDLKEADTELIKGSLYQKRTQKCKIIFLLALIVFALLMIVLLRPPEVTVIEKPLEPPRPQSKPDGSSDAINDPVRIGEDDVRM